MTRSCYEIMKRLIEIGTGCDYATPEMVEEMQDNGTIIDDFTHGLIYYNDGVRLVTYDCSTDKIYRDGVF